MSINQSNLSSTGFDYVVAVTQDSINGTLEEYLYDANLPEVVLCYIYDNNNNPTPIAYATLVANANNTDPFAVPDGTAGTDPRVQNLNNASFAFAIKAKLGLSPGVPPANLPPIVTLKAGQSNVIYTLMFSEFIATEMLYGPRNSLIWANKQQPSGEPWTFQMTVDLNFTDTDFSSLPPAVQNQLKNLSGQTFSIQQLYYDLNSAALESAPAFNDLPSNSLVNSFMQTDFIGTYWGSLKPSVQAPGGGEILGYGASQTSSTPASSLAVTDLNFFTPDAVGTEGAPLTLNYLCATNNDPLPDTTHAGFGWNWIEPGEVSQYDGAVALNRNTFANYLNNAELPTGGSLYDYVASNCYSPWVRVTYEGGIEVKVKYEWSMTPGQAPTVSVPGSGGTILSYSYASPTASDDAGIDGAAGKMELSSTFDLSVTVNGNQITIVQHLVIWTYVRYIATDDSGNIVDKQITDVYTIGVDDQGQIKATLESSNTVDNSKKPSANGFLNFWANVDTLSDDVTQWAQSCIATNLTDVPASFVQDFVFPGGGTFSFTDATFSDNQDLVSHITYADVT
jgi:hypothetical protein